MGFFLFVKSLRFASEGGVGVSSLEALRFASEGGVGAGRFPLLQDTRRYGPGGILASACARNR